MISSTRGSIPFALPNPVLLSKWPLAVKVPDRVNLWIYISAQTQLLTGGRLTVLLRIITDCLAQVPTLSGTCLLWALYQASVHEIHKLEEDVWEGWRKREGAGKGNLEAELQLIGSHSSFFHSCNANHSFLKVSCTCTCIWKALCSTCWRIQGET